MIDYYGTKDNYIHAKFGDLRKMYNFTEEFRKKYPRFCEEYRKYWEHEYGVFVQPQQIVKYVDHNKIPVHFYLNYTDKAVSIAEMYDYFEREVEAIPDALDIKQDYDIAKDHQEIKQQIKSWERKLDEIVSKQDEFKLAYDVIDELTQISQEMMSINV